PGRLAPRGRPRPANAPPLVVVDAAGPWGSGRSRELTTTGPGCGVVAPALRPQPAGARVTTARREAVPPPRRTWSCQQMSGRAPPRHAPVQSWRVDPVGVATAAARGDPARAAPRPPGASPRPRGRARGGP